MRKAHFDLTILHLQRTIDSRYDGRATAPELTASLAACLSGETPYKFISETVTHHTANFRTPIVDDFFGRLGVSSISRRCISTNFFCKYMALAGISASSKRPEAALDLVNDLVTRRNQVAHGDISNTIKSTGLIAYCEQVKAYCNSISEILYASFFEHAVEVSGVDHGKPISVFNNNIVCIQSKRAILKIGTILAIQRTNNTWYNVEIVELQMNNVAIAQTPADKDTAVGLKISGTCKATYRIKSLIL